MTLQHAAGKHRSKVQRSSASEPDSNPVTIRTVKPAGTPVTRPESARDASQREQQHKSGIEHGGVKGPEPTRYGDWEKNGRCIDF